MAGLVPIAREGKPLQIAVDGVLPGTLEGMQHPAPLGRKLSLAARRNLFAINT
jgi:hypothetical protein